MKCRRTACQSDSATCRHTQTGEMYCETCARRINRACYWGLVAGLPEDAGKVVVMTVNDQFVAVCLNFVVARRVMEEDGMCEPVRLEYTYQTWKKGAATYRLMVKEIRV